MAEPPAGFAPHFRQSPLTDPWEPLYSRRDGDALLIGVWVRDVHCNSRAVAHGGLIAALADNAMGLACVLASEGQGGPIGGIVTVNLSVDYLGAAKPGDWLEVAARPVRIGRSLAFAEAQVRAGDRAVARATAVFSVPAKG
ncbi:PaaI family thioesterase [Sphingomonas sp.]|uniref:PaaI family thioesterase n=1 Tax=Sphingomonas sp. TaxID=28214 RepID=UPI001DFEAD11|nr:PaaI family thioesterase [Sphingomonas sp.]MBX9797200.1 PaaI family thioesterase [Sphingomonas sp.]